MYPPAFRQPAVACLLDFSPQRNCGRRDTGIGTGIGKQDDAGIGTGGAEAGGGALSEEEAENQQEREGAQPMQADGAEGAIEVRL